MTYGQLCRTKPSQKCGIIAFFGLPPVTTTVCTTWWVTRSPSLLSLFHCLANTSLAVLSLSPGPGGQQRQWTIDLAWVNTAGDGQLWTHRDTFLVLGDNPTMRVVGKTNFYFPFLPFIFRYPFRFPLSCFPSLSHFWFPFFFPMP